MKQSIAMILVATLVLSLAWVPVSYAAWADELTVTDDFEGYGIAEGEWKDLKTATESKWTIMKNTYADAYLTKKNGNTYAVFKGFKADAIINSYLTKTDNGVHWYEQADGGKDKLSRDMMMRFQYYGASDAIMKKGVTYQLGYDFKYTSGDMALTAIVDRAGFVFPAELTTTYTAPGFSSYPSLEKLTSKDTQQIYGAGNNTVELKDGWKRGSGTLVFNTIMQKSGYDSTSQTNVQLEETAVNYLAYEFKGMAGVSSDGVDSIFVMLNDSFSEYITKLKAGTDDAELKAAATAEFTQRLAEADIRICLDNISFTEVFSDTLSLSGNTCNYVGTDREASALKISATKTDGTVYDLTGAEGVTYSSSDESVFRFAQGNLLESTGKNGKAVITATYRGKSVSVIMIRQDTRLNGQDGLEGQTYGVQTESNMPAKYKITDVAGHNDDVSWSAGTSTERTSKGEIYDLRLYCGRADNWFDRGYRSISGWFYDDLENPVGIYLGLTDSTTYTGGDGKTSNINLNLAEDMSYDDFDWTGMQSWSAGYKFEGTVGSSSYMYSGTKLADRTKGWHQIVFSLEKNPEAAWGWSVYTYLDGVVIRQVDIVPVATTKEPLIEMRGWVYYTSDAGVDTGTVDSKNNPIYRYNLYSAYYDDFLLCGSLEPVAEVVDTSVSLTCAFGTNGSVTVNGAAKKDGDVISLESGDSMTVSAVPADGYEIEAIKLGEVGYTPDSNGSVTIDNITENAVLTVTFKERTPIDPSVSGDQTYNYFKTVDDKPTAYVYAKLNDFYVPGGSDTQYGMKVWISGDSANKLVLPAINPETLQPAVAQAGAAYAIRVYGDAITAEQTYVFQPYVGETEGAEMTVTFNEE